MTHDIFAKNMQKQMRNTLLLSFAAILCVLGIGYIASHASTDRDTQKIQVVAAFFPLADFARSVGREYVQVTQIVPDGVEPHEYEPSPQDVAVLMSADILVVNGGGVDAWAEKLIPDAEAVGVAVVRMSDVVPFIERDGVIDPHAWLDMARAQEMVRVIAEALMIKDEAHATFYASTFQKVQQDLTTLDASFADTLSSCASRTIFVAHDAFSYWAFRYNVDVHAVSGVSPESEPSVQDLAQLIHDAKELGVTTILFESAASTALATTIAEEIGASVDVLSPLEGRTSAEIAAGDTYLTLMQKNLSALSRALSCNL